jgi:hypothetical protein
MKSLHFPVKGVGGLSLIFSEAFVVIVVVSAMVSSWCQSFDFGVSSIVESRSQGIGLSECQGVGVRCKDTGAFVDESTLLLDFGMVRQNVRQSELLCSLPKKIARSRGRDFV